MTVETQGVVALDGAQWDVAVSKTTVEIMERIDRLQDSDTRQWNAINQLQSAARGPARESYATPAAGAAVRLVLSVHALGQIA